MDEIPVLPSETVLHYLAEGAANIIFRYTLPPPSPSMSSDAIADLSAQGSSGGTSTPPPTSVEPLMYHPYLTKTPQPLLRLRKALPSSTQPLATTHAVLQKTVFPLFEPSQLMEYQLVLLPPKLIKETNIALKILESCGRRPEKRWGLYLVEDEPHGVLITDMSPNREGEVLVEIKPKWLHQSPDAPAGWKRCRTCALRAKKGGGDGFCPLDLVSGSVIRVEKAVRYFVEDPMLREQLSEFFIHGQGRTILERLRKLQMEFDKEGVISGDPFSPEFGIAMTVRDCSVYVKIPSEASKRPVEARIGDLDLKSAAGGKAEYWQELERSLIDEGWYTGTEKGRMMEEEQELWCFY